MVNVLWVEESLSAARKDPKCGKMLGDLIKKGGNHVYRFGEYRGKSLISFPTKNHWRDPSPLSLIRRSCTELIELWEKTVPRAIVRLPRVGCLNGGIRLYYSD